MIEGVDLSIDYFRHAFIDAQRGSIKDEGVV